MAADQTWLGTVQLIVKSANEEALPIVFTVPEGVHLASGLFYADGSGDPRQAAWQRCEPGSCIATGELNVAGQRAWQRGGTAEMRYRPRQGSPTVAVKLSLLGITAALTSAREAVQ